MANDLTLTYSTFTVVLSQFLGEDLPRAIVQSASADLSPSGTGIVKGPPVRQRFIWNVSALLSAANAETLMNLFYAWDLARAQGTAATVTVTDALPFAPGGTQQAAFTDPPKLRKLGNGWGVSFTLTQV